MKITISLLFLFITVSTISLQANVKEVGSMSELKEVITSKEPLVIMFYAPWCGACKSMREPFIQVAHRFAGQAKFARVNADNQKFKEAVDYFGVEAIPTILVKHVGVIDKDQLAQSIRCIVQKPNAPQISKEGESKKAPAKGESKSKKTKKPLKTAAKRSHKGNKNARRTA